MPNAKLIKVADSLLTLRSQLDAAFPGRSKRSDGFIGNAAHQKRPSDHNPEWRHGSYWYCTAGDFTHDPDGGLDCERLSWYLRWGGDPRIKYVIWRGQIMAGRRGPQPWVWREYDGSNPHTKHLHLSVVPELISLADTPWDLTDLIKEDDVTPEDVWSHPARDVYHGTNCRTVDLAETVTMTAFEIKAQLLAVQATLAEVLRRLEAK